MLSVKIGPECTTLLETGAFIGKEIHTALPHCHIIFRHTSATKKGSSTGKTRDHRRPVSALVIAGNFVDGIYSHRVPGMRRITTGVLDNKTNVNRSYGEGISKRWITVNY